MEELDKLANKPIRGEKGKLLPGQPSLNPKGRPKGKTIKERVLEWLETHPDDMEGFVKHFVKENRDLAWRMLEGNPPQKLEGDKDNPLVQIIFDSSLKPNDTNRTPESGSQKQ